MSLRDELSGATVADPAGYTLLTPPNWGRFTADDAGRDQLIARIKERFLEVSRPDLYAQMRTLITRQWQRLRAQAAIEIYMPVVPPVEGGTPMSLVTVPWIAQGDFDADVRSKAHTSGAVETLDDGEGGVVYRWENDRQGEGDLAGVFTREIVYVRPFPGDAPSRGLMVMTSITHPGATEGGAALRGFIALSDAIVSTLVWRFP